MASQLPKAWPDLWVRVSAGEHTEMGEYRLSDRVQDVLLQMFAHSEDHYCYSEEKAPALEWTLHNKLDCECTEGSSAFYVQVSLPTCLSDNISLARVFVASYRSSLSLLSS